MDVILKADVKGLGKKGEKVKASDGYARNFLFPRKLAKPADAGSIKEIEMKKQFKEDETSVLFATDSFWEGVDVPGSSLSQVIIVKLPFRVPDDPVFAARSEAVEQRGGSSFMELSVPEAVIKFRQGVGRLMRRSTDRGTVVVLDRRLVEKRYGRIFLEGIPSCRRTHGNLDELCSSIERFLD